MINAGNRLGEERMQLSDRPARGLADVLVTPEVRKRRTEVGVPATQVGLVPGFKPAHCKHCKHWQPGRERFTQLRHARRTQFSYEPPRGGAHCRLEASTDQRRPK